MIGQIETLDGTWTMVDENGQTMTGTTYQTTAAGSAVREIMFPGTEHEMVNLYHMDGQDLVMTHYCAMGNQPRLVASSPETDDHGNTVYRFNLESVSNLRPEHTHYMGGLTLAFKGDTLTQTWTSFDLDGNPAGTVEFHMSRK